MRPLPSLYPALRPKLTSPRGLANADARAVSYCSDARAIEVDQFLLQYYPDESLFGAGAGTISFDIA